MAAFDDISCYGSCARNEPDIKHIEDHFLIGDAFGLVSLFNRGVAPEGSVCDDACGDIVLGERLLSSYADSLHLGIDKLCGRWAVDCGADGGAGAEERFCLICCSPHELDLLEDLLRAFCRRYGQKGYVLVYNRRAFYIDEQRNKRCLGEAEISLEQLAQMCALLYEKNLPAEKSGSPGMPSGLFIVDRIENCHSYRAGISSFMGYVGYKTAVENLERYGDKLFDKFEEWNRPEK